MRSCSVVFYIVSPPHLFSSFSVLCCFIFCVFGGNDRFMQILKKKACAPKACVQYFTSKISSGPCLGALSGFVWPCLGALSKNFPWGSFSPQVSNQKSLENIPKTAKIDQFQTHAWVWGVGAGACLWNWLIP